jgi:hypothetical protein
MTAFWDTTPYSVVDVDRRFRGAYCLHHQGDVSITALMMETVRISETSVYFQESTRHYIQKAVMFILAAVRFRNLTNESIL